MCDFLVGEVAAGKGGRMKCWLVDDHPSDHRVSEPVLTDAGCRNFWRPLETGFPAMEGSTSVAVMSCLFFFMFYFWGRRLMTSRVLSGVSETVVTSTAGIPSAATPCLPLATAAMIPSTAWTPLAPAPGRHLRQM